MKDSVSVLYSANVSAQGCSLTSTGLNLNNRGTTLAIYPNPLSLETTLKASRNLNDAVIHVYNTFGQQVKQLRNLSGNSFTFYRDNLECGIYFLMLTERNKTIAKEKIIVVE
jgi:hypothetical protein